MPGWPRSCLVIFMSDSFPATRDPARDPEHPLARAFASFTEAAGSLEHDREHLRRQQALVEISALLAHEIRNPLGCLELFAGLLAEANLEGESRRWIEHVQAGLRPPALTGNNVLHPHNTPQPEPPPTDAGHLPP